MKRHRSFGQRPRSATAQPDLNSLEGVVSERILNAMCVAAKQLDFAGVRYGLAGGLAVGAYGYQRATKDVDFLVGDEAFVHHQGGFVTIAPGIPIGVGDVAVDPMSAVNEIHLDDALDAVIMTMFRGRQIPILSLEAIIYLKLKSPRGKDAVDVVELVKRGIDTKRIAAYLAKNASDLLPRFQGLIADADLEYDE